MNEQKVGSWGPILNTEQKENRRNNIQSSLLVETRREYFKQADWVSNRGEVMKEIFDNKYDGVLCRTELRT